MTRSPQGYAHRPVSQTTGRSADIEPLEAVPVEERDDRALVAVLSWALLVVVLVTAGWWAWTKVLFPDGGSTVAEFAKGKAGHYYASPADQFGAVFPTTPTRRARDDADGRTVTVASRPGSDYEFSVTRQPESPDAIESYRATLDQLAGAFVSDAGGAIVSQEDVKRLTDIDAAEKAIVFRKGGEYHHVWLILTTDRVYVLEATTPGRDDLAAARFRLGFTKLGG